MYFVGGFMDPGIIAEKLGLIAERAPAFKVDHFLCGS
jgi:hypothetical protein